MLLSDGGNAGTWFELPRFSWPQPAFTNAINNQNGVIVYIGYDNPLIVSGTVYTGLSRGCVSLAAVTDGTSNTFMYSERAHGMLMHRTRFAGTGGARAISETPASAPCIPSTRSGGTATRERSEALAAGPIRSSPRRPASIRAVHNFTFCDGSVKFLKESINCWAINPSTNLPNGVVLDSSGYVYQLVPGTQLGIDQALLTKAGGEVISSDAY